MEEGDKGRQAGRQKEKTGDSNQKARQAGRREANWRQMQEKQRTGVGPTTAPPVCPQLGSGQGTSRAKPSATLSCSPSSPKPQAQKQAFLDASGLGQHIVFGNFKSKSAIPHTCHKAKLDVKGKTGAATSNLDNKPQKQNRQNKLDLLQKFKSIVCFEALS